MSETTVLHTPYSDAEQQRDASTIGMWIFLATEVMFFGTLLTAYGYFHHLYPEAFASAARQTDFWLGSVNTAVLLISSLCMALAVHAARTGERRSLRIWLAWTMILGTAFLVCKGVEYQHHIQDHLWPGSTFVYADPALLQGAELFFYLYFVMTSLHALHMVIGIMVLAVMFSRSQAGSTASTYQTPVELIGLYWHFVDIVWIFLFPLFYLMGGR